MPSLWAAGALATTGEDSGQVRQRATDSLTAAERATRPGLGACCGFSPVVLCIVARGDWHAAREFLDRGLDLAPSNPLVLPVRIMLEYQVGDFEQGEVYLERLLEIVRLTASGPTVPHTAIALVIPMVARIAGNGQPVRSGPSRCRSGPSIRLC